MMDIRPSARVRLLLADDHQALLKELARFLSREFEIVGEASDGAMLLDMAAKLKPDVVVTDLKMPKVNGLDAARELLAKRTCKAVIVLTMHGDVQLVKTAVKYGIQGYVLKVNAEEDLIPAIHQVLNGGRFVSAAIGSGSPD